MTGRIYKIVSVQPRTQVSVVFRLNLIGLDFVFDQRECLGF